MSVSIITQDTQSLSTDGGGGDDASRRSGVRPPTTIRTRTPTSSRHRITYESLVGRPRSNPRSRTPMRYESPLNHDEFRRDRVAREEDSSVPVVAVPNTVHEAHHRITIRPTAGQPVGVVVPAAPPPRASVVPERTRAVSKSRKQGPSRRKTRRWNNDNFVDVASEFDTNSVRGKKAVEVLAKAKANAHLYRSVYDPQERRSDMISRFMEKQKYKTMRDQFFEGEIHATTLLQPKEQKKIQDKRTLDASGLFRFVDARLRNVLIKACENSEPARRIVKTFEDFLIASFDDDDNKEETTKQELPPRKNDFWKGVLLKAPTVMEGGGGGGGDDATKKKKKNKSVHFHFDGSCSSGGFHRLLFHAVCQFHGLKTVSSTVHVSAAAVAGSSETEPTPPPSSEETDWSVVGEDDGASCCASVDGSFLLVENDRKTSSPSSCRPMDGTAVTTTPTTKNTKPARLLSVTGTLLGAQYRLLDHLATLS